MESLNLKTTFFEALGLPEYARPNFYLIKQQESGWSKGVYLLTLEEVYHHCSEHLTIVFRSKKRSQPELRRQDLKIAIKDITKGSETGFVDEKLLTSLFISVRSAYSFGVAPRHYSAIEILQFVEHSLAFIRTQFLEQVSKHQQIEASGGTNRFWIYYIATDGPYFDAQKFKTAAYELLFSAGNSAYVLALFKQYKRVSVELVNLWNNKLFFIEQDALKAHPANEQKKQHVELTSDFKLLWHTNGLDEHFEMLSPQPYMNQNLAHYAANIANSLSFPLGQKSQEISVRSGSYDFLSDFKLAIKTLLDQNNDISIENIRNKKRLEAPFRDWFHRCFSMRSYVCSRETLRGNGHIDLKVHTAAEGDKIIEFKGWWDSTRRKTVVKQLCEYLTQFEGDGYIVMINQSKKNVVAQYKQIVFAKHSGYVRGSWKNHRAGRGLAYYSSRHRSNGEEKEVYHFIINVS
jgi:hypothetical protein